MLRWVHVSEWIRTDVREARRLLAEMGPPQKPLPLCGSSVYLRSSNSLLRATLHRQVTSLE
jgi:hypothetical protein